MTEYPLPRAVIFDWDNTLVDSWGAIEEAINYVRARYGLPTWNRVEILANCTRSARDSFPDWFGDKWEEACKDYYAAFDKVRVRRGLDPAQGAADLLAWLLENNIPALVVSNKSGPYLREEETHLGWNKYFVAVVGAGDAISDKPARECAEHALRIAGIEAGADIWFIGDSETDVTCARNAGCWPVLVGDGAFARKLGVECFAADCGKIVELLKNMNCARSANNKKKGNI